MFEALTGIIQSSVFFFETLFLAHVDPQTLAAGALVSWLFGVLATILFGTLGSINILISHKHGANDDEGIKLVVRDGLLLAGLLTVPAFILSWNANQIALQYMGTLMAVIFSIAQAITVRGTFAWR